MSEPLRTCRICGLEAWNKEALELFSKDSSCTHGRQQICKKCKSKETMKIKASKPKSKPHYLRKCRNCGLEALAEADLEKFIRRKTSPYGRHTECKECHNERNRIRRKINPNSDTRRRKKEELIKGFPKPITCYYCGEEVTKLYGLDSDSLHIHSLDENHENWDPPNKVPTHHRCHTRFHILGDKNPKRRNKIKKGKD